MTYKKLKNGNYSYNGEEGVFRTIGGKRVFIRKGEDLATAMKNSGKFKLANKKSESKSNSSTDSKIKQLYNDTWNAKKDYNELKQELDKLKNSGEATQEDIDRVKKEAQKEYNKQHSATPYYAKMTKKEMEQDLKDRKSKLDNNWYDEKDKKMYQNFYNQGKHDYENWYGEKEEHKEQTSNTTSNTTSDWRTQIQANKDKLEKDLQDFKEKNKNNMTNEKVQNEYYELFRKNERENAKLKKEEPNEKYEFVEAYAGYKDKFKDTWGEDGSGEKVASAKMYTNDEFMEHLEDANWHSERRQLLEANLTNKELEYIKNRTNVSAWGVENLNGKEQVDALIKEAKENANKDKGLNLSQRQIDEGNRLAQKSENGVREDLKTYFGIPSSKENFKGKEEELITGLSNEWGIDKNRVKELYKEEDIKHRYDGTIKNLQQATNLSMEEILEIVKEIEKKNKK